MESLLVPIVNRILGEYISNLEPKQLEMSLWSGQVKLKNLELRRDMFSQWNIPISVVYGKIDNLMLIIPWNDLRTKPLKIQVGNVYLLCQPALDHFDLEDELQRKQEKKKQRLREAEESLERKDNYFSNLLNAIIDNLQISIEKIHFRYEDTTDSTFGVGLTLSELSAISCNSDWQAPIAEKKPKEMVYKLIEMKSFAVYCEANSTSYSVGTDAEKNARFFAHVWFSLT